MNVSRQAYNFPKVKLRRLRRKTYEEKYDIRDKNLRTIIACSFIKQPGPASQYMMQVKQHVHGKFQYNAVLTLSPRLHVKPLMTVIRAILGDISCIRSEPKQCINTWQITEVSNSAKRHADNSVNRADL